MKYGLEKVHTTCFSTAGTTGIELGVPLCWPCAVVTVFAVERSRALTRVEFEWSSLYAEMSGRHRLGFDIGFDVFQVLDHTLFHHARHEPAERSE